MKKLFIKFALIVICLSPLCIAYADIDYDELYNNANSTPPKLMHNIDPFQDEDYLKYAWSPYPLFRTSSTLYFRDLTISPGYYTLAPRKLKGTDYIFFKELGKVSFIIPVAKKEMTPVGFYEKYVPTPKLTKWGKIRKDLGDTILKHARNSKRIPPPKSYIEATDVGRYFLIKLYYGDDCFWLLFRRIKY